MIKENKFKEVVQIFLGIVQGTGYATDLKNNPILDENFRIQQKYRDKPEEWKKKIKSHGKGYLIYESNMIDLLGEYGVRYCSVVVKPGRVTIGVYSDQEAIEIAKNLAESLDKKFPDLQIDLNISN